jgi:uncharacterized protein YpmS
MSRKILLLLGFISLVGMGYFLSLQNDDTKEPEIISKQEQVELEINKPQLEEDINTNLSQVSEGASLSTQVVITEEEIAELEACMKRGDTED